MGSWKGRRNQYIEFVRDMYCKLPTNGKQLPAFPLEAVTGSNPGLRGGRRECYHSATMVPDDLKEIWIWIYTCNLVYKQVNAAMRRVSESEFPVSDDLLLSLNSLFLTAVLLHWTKLECVQETTFRGLTLPSNQAKLYQRGKIFHWLPFTSRTRVKNKP